MRRSTQKANEDSPSSRQQLEALGERPEVTEEDDDSDEPADTPWLTLEAEIHKLTLQIDEDKAEFEGELTDQMDEIESIQAGDLLTESRLPRRFATATPESSRLAWARSPCLRGSTPSISMTCVTIAPGRDAVYVRSETKEGHQANEGGRGVPQERKQD